MTRINPSTFPYRILPLFVLWGCGPATDALPNAGVDMTLSGSDAVGASTDLAVGASTDLAEAPVVPSGALRWTARKPMPTPRVDFATVVHNNKIYTIGGYTGSMNKAVEAYDPATDSWQRKADALSARRLAVAATVGDKIYLIGGLTGYQNVTYLNVTEQYDPANDQWTARSSAPFPPGPNNVEGNRYLTGGVIGDKIYVVVWVPGQSSTFAYDPAGDTWTRLTDAAAFYDEVTAGTIDKKLYVMSRSGWGHGMGPRIFAHYDPAQDQWTNDLPPPGTPGARVAVTTAAYSGRIYGVGGFLQGVYSPDGALGVVQYFDPAIGQWKGDTSLGVARAIPGAAVANGKLYVIGGSVTYPRGNPVATGAVEEGAFQ